MTEPLHKQSYDKFVKRISNMQQLTSNFLKKCAFRPHSRAEPGYGKRACQFIDCAAGVAINRACEAGGCFAKGVGTRAPRGNRPQRLQLSVVFFDDFS